MRDEIVLDASVAAKCFITEEGSEAARRLAKSGVRLAAPDLIFVELASVAAKRVLRGDIGRLLADDIVASAPDLLDQSLPIGPSASQAMTWAIDHGLSVHDSLYLACAEKLGTVVVTADKRLVTRAQAAGLGHLVEDLA